MHPIRTFGLASLRCSLAPCAAGPPHGGYSKTSFQTGIPCVPVVDPELWEYSNVGYVGRNDMDSLACGVSSNEALNLGTLHMLFCTPHQSYMRALIPYAVYSGIRGRGFLQGSVMLPQTPDSTAFSRNASVVVGPGMLPMSKINFG